MGWQVTFPLCLSFLIWKMEWLRAPTSLRLRGLIQANTKCLQNTKHWIKLSYVAQWQRINLPVEETQETRVWSLGREDPLQWEMATISNIPSWKIPWPKEPGRLQSIWSQIVGHEWAPIRTYTSKFDHT